jgi:RimJ/RimL family protein N-acetyltransferase
VIVQFLDRAAIVTDSLCARYFTRFGGTKIMDSRQNSLGQPIGLPVDNWQPRPLPPRTTLEGHYCRIEPLDADHHGADLYAAYAVDTEDRVWTYMSAGPFESEEAFQDWVQSSSKGDDPLFCAIIDKVTDKAVGVASYLRIDPDQGVIEVGNINYSPSLQQTAAATEVIYLMMRRVFVELGYRRFEWKCDHLNAPSRRAAERLGFSFEGIFRQAIMYKGRNRDTAWYSIIDTEWPVLDVAYNAWLDGENFDAAGHQKMTLGELIAGYRASA